jgi:hypothetical protein
MATTGFLDPVVLALLNRISPSGTLAQVAAGNPELDALQQQADGLERAALALREPSLVEALEDDFAAYVVPALVTASVPLEAWAIPILSALVSGPFTGIVSAGLIFACHVAILALQGWSAKRLAAEKAKFGGIS